MGRERRRTRLYVYHGLACMILLAGSACAQFRAVFPERPAHLQRVRESIDKGEFDAAVRGYQNDLAQPAGHADESLFDLGLLYAHYANPKKDYQKALGCFTRLVKEHPQSPLAEEAGIWASVLESMERSKRVDLEIENMKKLTK